MCIDEICRDSEFVTPEPLNPNHDSIIKVIGVGGGGGNAVSYMYRQGVKGVKFVVCNTDKQALDASDVPDRVLLGHTGLGAGDKPDVAREAAEESIDAISAMFDANTKMVFITAGMGGGTGTGAGPIVARVARERGVLTVGIVTIPFLFEGMKKIKKALDGAEEIKKYVDALLLINNERLIDIYPDLNFDSAFDKADDTLATAARSISELITTNDVRINIDFNDVDTTLRNGGSAIISCGYGEGENRVQDAISDALQSPLLKNNNIMGSKRLLFNLYISRKAEKPFLAGEMKAFTEFVTSIDGVEVIYGVAYDDTLGDKIKLTILASGFEAEKSMPEKTTNPGHGFPPAGGPLSTKEQTKDQTKVIEEQYGKDKVQTLAAAKAKNLYVILKSDQLDDDNVIENLEKYPAYARTTEQKAAIAEAAPASSANNPRTSAPTPAEDSAIIF